MLDFLKEVGLVRQYLDACGAVVDKHASVYPLRVRNLEELHYQTRNPPGSTI